MRNDVSINYNTMWNDVNINYNPEKVGWKKTWASNVYPTDEFFIHVWQRATSISAVVDTIKHAWHAHMGERLGRCNIWGVEQRLNAHYHWCVQRAGQLRRKGAPLMDMNQQRINAQKWA